MNIAVLDDYQGAFAKDKGVSESQSAECRHLQ